SLSFATSRPCSAYSPQSGRSRRPTRFIRVDFPEPERPRIAINSPCSIESATSDTARMMVFPEGYCLEIPVVWISGISKSQADTEIAPLGLRVGEAYDHLLALR